MRNRKQKLLKVYEFDYVEQQKTQFVANQESSDSNSNDDDALSGVSEQS
jgi:hypothetical protein